MTFEAFARRRKLPITAYLFSMACCNVSLLLREVAPLRVGYQDFTIYYMSGLLLREGRASMLYDMGTQYQTQLSFAHVPIRHGALPFNHPPFEAPLFVPFTFLRFWPAYLVWTALSLVLLAASAILLRRFPAIRALHPGLIAITTLAFFPLVNGLLQGQDSVLLMFLAVLALTCLDRGADVAAGACLAFGLFRPHMVIPLLLLLAVRRWRMLVGFAAVSVFLGGISVAIMGWGWPKTYVRFVFLVEQARIRNLPNDAERHQGDRMGMHDGPNIRPPCIDGLVKRKLGRRRVTPFHPPIGANADDILAAQASLIDPRRRDPHVAGVVAN